MTTIRELYKNPDKYIDQKVVIGGWIRNLRDSKTFGFLVINDGTYFKYVRKLMDDNEDIIQNWLSLI